MLTRRKPHARPVNAPPRFFALRLTKADVAKLDSARTRMTSILGGTPSNPMFFEELLRVYLETTSPEDTLINSDIEGMSALDI